MSETDSDDLRSLRHKSEESEGENFNDDLNNTFEIEESFELSSEHNGDRHEDEGSDDGGKGGARLNYGERNDEGGNDEERKAIGVVALSKHGFPWTVRGSDGKDMVVVNEHFNAASSNQTTWGYAPEELLEKLLLTARSLFSVPEWLEKERRGLQQRNTSACKRSQ
jgi:hypothetical protein